MLFERKKPLDLILETAEKRSLKRQLGAFDLTMLGIGAVIGTGIFVLTAVAANKAGPGMMYSFVIAGIVCALTALIYSEIAAMVPVSGSAYTYSYAVLGEIIAWMVGWALILEYAVAAGAVAVGWSGYANGFLAQPSACRCPSALTAGPGDTITLADGTDRARLVQPDRVPARRCSITWLLVIGTSKSAKFTAVLVIVKIIALTAFIALAFPAVNHANFEPMLPNGWGTPLSGVGVLGAAASIFFAYVGFDAVSTAAEETKNPNRNIPIGLIGSLAICTVFYLLVAYAAVGAMGAQPGGPLSQSKEPLAFVLRDIGYPSVGNWVAMRRDHRAAVGRADDDLRPDPHPVHDGARRPAAGSALARCTRASTRRTWSPGSPASPCRCSPRCSRSACWPTSPTPARCSRSSWSPPA